MRYDGAKGKGRKQSSRDLPTRPRGPRSAIIAAAILLAVGIAAALLLRVREPGGTRPPEASPAAQGTRAPAMTAAADSGLGAVTGRWLRLDGGYVLEIRSVDAGGAIDAVYLNPQPINVARAEATRDGSTLKVFVELRAPNYPGSTYTLTYDPSRDQLAGMYFQAAMQQRFDVVFVRMK
jgi:hypothetical protein